MEIGFVGVKVNTMDINKQLEIIKRGAIEIISEEELRAKLLKSARTKTPLVVKAGFDPTASDIHLGHTVILRKLRQFQDLGHRVVFLIGDFTARIGDPSGRSEKRTQLSSQQVERFALTYKAQVSKLLNTRQLKSVANSKWFDRMSVLDILELTAHATVSQMLARADFKKRLSNNEEVSLLEFMYPLLQGYDSVRLKADIEIGGTDQIFNLLVGRDMQKDFSQEPQVVITLPLLEGTDGVLKMSKSSGNYIGIDESPFDMFGKIMSITDELMLKYYTLLTEADLNAVKAMHPKEAKLRLAREIVSVYHSPLAAKEAQAEFEKVFSQKEVPDAVGEFALKGNSCSILDILLLSKLVASRNEARRLIRQGGVYFGAARIDKEDAVINSSGVIKVGKRRFLKVIK